MWTHESQPWDWTQVSCTAGGFFIVRATREVLLVRLDNIDFWSKGGLLFHSPGPPKWQLEVVSGYGADSSLGNMRGAIRYPLFFLLSCSCSVAQSSLTLCNPVNCSTPDSSVCGILQARILEWVAISFSRGSTHLTSFCSNKISASGHLCPKLLVHVSFVYVIYWFSTGGDVVTPTPPLLPIWHSLENPWVMTTWVVLLVCLLGSSWGCCWTAYKAQQRIIQPRLRNPDIDKENGSFLLSFHCL